MIEPQPTVPDASAPSVAELVFAGEPRAGGRRFTLAAVAVASVYLALLAIVRSFGPSAGPWGVEAAARIHDAIAAERSVDVAPPPARPAAPANPSKAVPTIVAARVNRTTRASRPATSVPAEAGQVVAAAAAPADFTGLSFVVGSGSTYAGGSTTAKGTSPAPGLPAPGSVAKPAAAARDRSQTVTLDEAAWSCPWPAEADAQQVNEQTVVLRVAVSSGGRADRVDVLWDPGFGFGAAARACALATRFEPARDPAGQPVAASSPPIRVHFFR